MHVAAIMPCRGRAAQTAENVRRLLATAGLNHDVDWQLHLAGGYQESGLLPTIASQIAGETGISIVLHSSQESQLSYWHALTMATERTSASLLLNLANDLWACDDWLKFAVADYQARFGQGDGLLGFAGDGHGPQHSCHFLISRGLLERYGGWPVWYQHNFGDTELCTRAQQDGIYHKSTTAWLEHCHPMLERAPDDAVYQAGRATYQQDQALFVARRAAGWPRVSQ